MQTNDICLLKDRPTWLLCHCSFQMFEYSQAYACGFQTDEGVFHCAYSPYPKNVQSMIMG